MAKGATITNKSGDTLYPKTCTDMVMDTTTGNSLTETIGDMSTRVGAFVDLGLFPNKDDANNAAIEFASNKSVYFIKYETSDGCVGIIRQLFGTLGNTLQYLWYDGVEYVRTVNYTSGLKSKFHNINKASLVYKLQYDQGSRVVSFYDPIQENGFGGVEIPEATKSVAGLMSTGSQTFAGVKTFNDNINIASKSVIAKNIDPGEFKLLHNNSSKGFIVRTRSTSDNILPLEMLSTNGYDSLKYEFPSKSGTVALLSDIEALTQQIAELTQRVTAIAQANNEAQVED